ncbi:S1C family serine protease [Streptomyces sp. 7-21]|uniref:S1C family serine protease n=1 Tax=Streptomyces sp. 7-21 TaxID=2802283 RepID=UPI00191F475D|nr:trypsin-like peptidase domain-containing protein [Streptomyces sp. 7-21]MBL1068553.1 trypsin-like peptidase domain-containing protein [Streptomyces sp. 7-21]
MSAYEPFPPVPEHAPPRPAHEPPSGRARRRGPAAVLAAVALVAAAVGGGTSALVTEALSGDGGSAAAVPGTNVSVQAGSSVADVAAAVAPSVVEITTGSSTGAGVILSETGQILTNNHVVSGAEAAEVTFHDGSTATAAVTATDPDSDLAVIQAQDVRGLTPATLGDSDSVAVGDQVVAIGSPEGLTGTVTSGIVSALDREVTVSREDGQRQGNGGAWPFVFDGGTYHGDPGPATTTYEAMQTDASLNHGNSGGPLINMNGEVIGVNSAMYSPTRDGGSTGLGFAIPINTVKDVLGQLGTEV